MAVAFHFADVSFTLTQRRSLKHFIVSLFEREGKPLQQLDYIFCSDDYLLKINQDFLQHDDLTDIITFDLTDGDEEAISGEIYISYDRIKENASLHNTTTSKELLRVMFHGALHLCGFKDKHAEDKEVMTAKEDEYLALYVSQETVSKQNTKD